MSDDATRKALEQVSGQRWELNPLRARYRVVGPAARVERMLAAGLPLEFDAVSVGLRDGGPQVALIPLDESSVETGVAIAALPQLVRNGEIAASFTTATSRSVRETARQLEVLLGQARSFLANLEQASQLGWYDAGAADSARAARERAVELVAHLERALAAQHALAELQRT